MNKTFAGKFCRVLARSDARQFFIGFQGGRLTNSAMGTDTWGMRDKFKFYQ